MKLKAGTGSQVLPDGSYDAKLDRIDEAQNADGSYLKWFFAVSDEGQVRSVMGLTDMNLDAGSKARFWTEALLGRPLRDGEEVDLEQLHGKPCRLQLTTVEKNGRNYNRIGRVEKPAGTTLTAGKAPAAQEDPDSVPF